MSSWGLNGPVTIVHQGGMMVKLAEWSGITSSTQPRSAGLYMPDGNPAYIDQDGFPVGAGKDGPRFELYYPEVGTPSGWIQGNDIHITVEWLDLNPKVASANVYTGTIDSTGAASGSCLNTQNRITDRWHIVEHFAQGF